MQRLRILVVGATGQQGRATISALTAASAKQEEESTPDFDILALTRSAASPRARVLQAEFPDLTLVEGSTRDPAPIFAAHPDVTSIFLVTVPPDDEEAQAAPLIDAAVARGVRHVVFSSVDRGGDEASWADATPVPHFASKLAVELRLRWAAAGAGPDARTEWTILRPTGFMDNYGAPSPFSRTMAALWATMPPGHTMQLVSVRDIGVFAAKALLRRGDWAGRAVGLAGDELTLGEAQRVFRRTMGYEMPRAWTLVGRGVRLAVPEARASMRWFEEVGFGVDIAQLREEEPGLQDFEAWLRTRYPQSAVPIADDEPTS